MTDIISTSDKEPKFNWRNVWYPVVFLIDIPKNKPFAFTIYEYSFVLFCDDNGDLVCLRDRCPHRGARLSDGRVFEGKLECLYHGWQFDSSGNCVRIPQLLSDKSIPSRACAKSYKTSIQQGLVWVWAGNPDDANEQSIPVVDALDDDEVYHVDYQVDLPYDQSYLIENIIDVAHIHTAHSGLRGGGHRELALPLEFQLLENSVAGIRAHYKSVGIKHDTSAIVQANVNFIAPNLIHYSTNYKNSSLLAGLALYSIPLSHEKCRLFYRKYSNFYSWRERIRPRFVEHWIQNRILQQDMALIVGQKYETEKSGKQLRELWMPIKSSDRLVLQFRKWIDQYAYESPGYRGFDSHATVERETEPKSVQTNFEIHTRQCSSCLKVFNKLARIKLILFGSLVLTLPIFVFLLQSSWIIPTSVIYIILVVCLFVTNHLEKKFL